MTERASDRDQQILKEFGRIVARHFDGSLSQAGKKINDILETGRRPFESYFAGLSSNEKHIAVAQIALEYFLHDFFSEMEGDDHFKLVYDDLDGRELDLKTLTLDGLHWEQFGWLEEFSENENMGEKLTIPPAN